MSIDFFEITFTIKSKKLAMEIGRFISESKKDGCDLSIKSNVISGSYYSSEYDEQYDGWEPDKKLPFTDSVVEWILDVITHGNLINKEGRTSIGNNLNDLEKDLGEYVIMHFKNSPQGENYVSYQIYDGQHERILSMGETAWDSMWSSQRRNRAEEIFNNYNLNIEDFARTNTFIGDTFDYLKDTPLFLELLEEFGQITIIEKTSQGEIPEKVIAFKNPELTFFKSREIRPDEAVFKGKTVGMGEIASLYPDDEENLYFGNHGPAFDFASRIIKMKGGKTTKTISANTDYVVVSRQMKNRYGDNNDRAASAYKDYCRLQIVVKDNILEADRKRQKKGDSDIRIIFEDSFYDWIKSKYDKMKG